MRGRRSRTPLPRALALLAALLLLVTLAPAQEDASSGIPVRAGPGQSDTQTDDAQTEESPTDGTQTDETQMDDSQMDGEARAALEELRAIHERLGDLIARLEGAPASGGLERLEQRVAELERLVRGSAVREAQRQLAALQGDVQADPQGDGDPAALADRVDEIRAGLESAYLGAGDRDVDERALGKELTTEFDALAEMLRSGDDPAEAFNALQGRLDELARSDGGMAAQNGGPSDAQGDTGAQAAGDGSDGSDGGDASSDTSDDGSSDASDASDASDTGDADDGSDGDDAGSADGSDDGAGSDGGEAASFDFQTLGPQVYASNCAACHQTEGQGVEGAYPALAGNGFVTGPPTPVIQTLLNGRGGMPAFGSSLSDEEIAAVISHVRNAWGNEAEPVTPEQVATVRGGGTVDEGTGDPNARPGAAN